MYKIKLKHRHGWLLMSFFFFTSQTTRVCHNDIVFLFSSYNIMVLVFAVIFLKRTVLHEVVVDISWSLCEVFVFFYY